MIQCMSEKNENKFIFKPIIIMKTAKITEITKVNKWDKWEHWPIYYISMKLDNNETITLWKKKEDAFKVGDSVSYETVEEGKKWKEVKENPFKPRQFDSMANNKSATIWMAMKIAFEVLYDKTNYNETIQLATRIFEDAMAIYENYWKGENKSDENEDLNLPF